MNFTISPFDQRMIPYFMCHACLLSENLCNLYVQWQKYCFIVCMRVVFVWISHLINWWFYIWLFLRCVFSGNSSIACDVYFLKSLNDSLHILWWYILRCIFSEESVWLVVQWQTVVYVYVHMFFFVIYNCSHAVLSSIYAVPMREWLDEHSCMSPSFPAAMLGGAFWLMLGFRIFQRLCSWPFMYEFHNFTILSTD